MKKLLNSMKKYGGSIVLMTSLDLYDRNQARASSRIFTDKTQTSYIWNPPARLMPVTDEEIQDFERWYPLEVELPESLKSANFLFKKNKNFLKKKTPWAENIGSTVYGNCQHGNNMANCMECLDSLAHAIFDKPKK